MNLTDFLLARIAEDEAAARAAAPWQTGSRDEAQPVDWRIHMRNWSPTRVLAECDAKRQLIEIDGRQAKDKGILAALALPYVNHPEYDPAWRP